MTSPIQITSLFLQVSVRNVYGNTVIYPENDVAKAIAALAGTKTLTPAALGIATRQLGAGLEFVNSHSEAETSIRQLIARFS
jgi:hypothetical protein